MNPLYRNDQAGRYPDSWYAASCQLPDERPALAGDMKADVAVIGAGYTGLSAALHLAQKGLDTIVIDAHRVGFGASGRNGGQVGSGLNKDQRWIEKRLGAANARAIWDLTLEAKKLTRDLVANHAPGALYRPGVLQGEWTVAGADHARRYCDWMKANYSYDTEYLDKDAFREICPSNVYQGGVLDLDAGHLHPMRYALGLARAAENAGARIFERTEAIALADGVVRTSRGTIQAKHIVVAGNGYLPNISTSLAARIMPINSFIAATEPLGAVAETVLTRDIAVADDKFVVNYFRLSEDKRLLFGGRESYSIGFPSDVLTALRARMVRLFPSLADVDIAHHWGGTLGITMQRLPYISRLNASTLAAGGYSGHGVAMAGLTGKIMAETVAGQAGRFDLLASLPVSPFPGGAATRAPLLTLAMTWYRLRDRLGF